METKKILIYCGAHAGGSLSQIWQDFDRVYAFEANPALADALQRKFPTATVINAAVGAEDGVAEFHVYGHDGGSSSMGVINPDAVRIVENYWPPGHFDEHAKYKVPMVNLANFCEREGIVDIDTLITDIQGMDATVLDTMSAFLWRKKIRHVKTECDSDSVPHYTGLPDNSFSRVQRLFHEMLYRQVSGPTASWIPDADHLQADLEFTVMT